VLGAVIGWSASAKGPGEYRVTGGGKFTLGAADAAAESRVAAVAAAPGQTARRHRSPSSSPDHGDEPSRRLSYANAGRPPAHRIREDR